MVGAHSSNESIETCERPNEQAKRDNTSTIKFVVDVARRCWSQRSTILQVSTSQNLKTGSLCMCGCLFFKEGNIKGKACAKHQPFDISILRATRFLPKIFMGWELNPDGNGMEAELNNQIKWDGTRINETTNRYRNKWLLFHWEDLLWFQVKVLYILPI